MYRAKISCLEPAHGPRAQWPTIPQMFSLAIAFPTQKFLHVQGRVAALAWISLAAHVAILALLVGVLGWGLRGAAATYDVTSWGIAVAQLLYVTRRCRGHGWDGLSWEAVHLRGLWAFAKLLLASAVMLCLEVWSGAGTLGMQGYSLNTHYFC